MDCCGGGLNGPSRKIHPENCFVPLHCHNQRVCVDVLFYLHLQTESFPTSAALVEKAERGDRCLLNGDFEGNEMIFYSFVGRKFLTWTYSKMSRQTELVPADCWNKSNRKSKQAKINISSNFKMSHFKNFSSFV